MEAYNAVYENQEQLDEARISRSMGRRATQYRRDQEQSAHMERVKKHQNSMENDPEYRERHERLRQTHSRREDQKESFDLFDYLLEYLVAEGYADTNKAALAIMANMSEEWKQDIMEISQKTATRAFATRATNEFESDSENASDRTKSGKSKADVAKSRIEKKFGKKAGQHADRAAHAGIFGRKSFSMPKKP